jgi:hypothetical protein
VTQLVRPLIGAPVMYLGRKIEVRHMGPDLLCFVDGVDMDTFYLDSATAVAGGQRYVDAVVKAEADLAKKSKPKR